MIAWLERRDGWPDPVNNANALMTENAAGLASRDVTLEDVQVGSANRRLYYFDDRVRHRSDFRLRTLFKGFLPRPPGKTKAFIVTAAESRARVAGLGIVVRVMVCHLSGELVDGPRHRHRPSASHAHTRRLCRQEFEQF